MTIKKHDLENFYHLGGEIGDIERQLVEISQRRGNYVADTYRDYSHDARGKIKIVRGYGLSQSAYDKQQKLKRKLIIKRDLLISKKTIIEEELDNVDEAIIRRIVRLRYFDRLSWDAVAIAIDGTKSGESMRMRLNRYLDSTG